MMVRLNLPRSGLLEPDVLEDDEFEDIADDLFVNLTLGKKRKVLLSDIDKAGNLHNYKADLKKDIEALESLINNLEKFKKTIKSEVAGNKNHKSKDDKLQSLIEEIKEKRTFLFLPVVDCIFFTKDTNFETDTKIFESILDAIAFELYFPDHMKERKIDVLKFVEKDINEVMQDKEFETLSDTQKEQVTIKLHNRWSNPDSEIVKCMNSFAEKSPEILKTILEG